MDPKVIKTEAEYEAAISYVAELMDAKAGSAAEEELDLWSLLVEKYEKEHFPIEKPDPIAAIKFRMEQQSLTQADLSRILGSKSKASEILRRRRPLSLNMIRSFHTKLGIPAEILLQPSKIRPVTRNRRNAKAAA